MTSQITLPAGMPSGLTPREADARADALGRREDVVPGGLYCYRRTDEGKVPCPYWALDPQLERQMDGYCALLGESDTSAEGFSMLWDQVKSCGINDDPEFDDPA